MQDAISTYLKFVPFTKLETWSYSYLLEEVSRYKKDFQTIKIGNFLKSSRQSISIDDEKFYDRVTVKINTNGVVKRDTEKGINIGTKKQFKAKEGQFIVSKIDARNGAFGIIPNELNGAIVTNDFPLFDIDKDIINPQFFFLITGTKEFINFAKSCSSGTTNRQRMDITMFLNQKIPLPSLSEQETLVKNYFSKIEEAEKLNQQANDLEGEIERYLFDELDIKFNSKSQKGNLFQLVNFDEISRWDSPFLLGKIPTIQSKYKQVSFSEVIKYFNKDENYKSIRVDSSKFPNDDFRYIGMEHIEKETGILLNMPIVKGKEIKSQTIRVPKNFFIYGKLRPYLNKYWINQTELDNIICSSEFFVFDIESEINKPFFKIILSSKMIQDQIADKTSGARMPRINEEIFFDLKVPLPPIEKQNEIVNHIQQLKEKINENKAKAGQLKKQAEQEFEQEIFIS